MATAAFGAATTGVAALGTAAVNSYADYEQLVGGIETLFGTGGAKTVEEYAQNVGKSVDEVIGEYQMLSKEQEIALMHADEAYKTAGMSANEYMQTITGFAASLKQSTETNYEAVQAADQAVIDMADNANKMGSSMESIQNAYQGFAKQNYTMLDNLKLGYGGTKEEMERLLADATALSGVEYDISNLSDVYSAIHVIQEELGITGTTAKEASSTISGSVAAMKASWSNLLTGMADENADFDTLVNNFVESAATVAENILPRVEVVLSGIGQLIESLLPVIVNRIPEIVNNILPQLLQSGMNITTTLLSGIQANLPEIMNGALLMMQQFITTLIGMLPQLLEIGLQMIIQLALGIAQALPEMIPTIVEVINTMVMTLVENIPLLIDAALQLMIGLATGIVQALPTLIEMTPQIVIALVTGLIENAPKLLDAAMELITQLAVGIVTYTFKLASIASQTISSLKNYFTTSISNLSFSSIGQNIIDGIWSGISAGWSWLKDKVSNLANELFEAAKNALDIHSPSRKFKWLAEMCVAGFDEGMEDMMKPQDMTRSVNASLSSMKNNIAGGKANAEYSSFNQTINVNQQISTPDELARAIRVESKYGLMRGVAFG